MNNTANTTAALSTMTCSSAHAAATVELLAHLRDFHQQSEIRHYEQDDRMFLRDLHRVILANAGVEHLIAR